MTETTWKVDLKALHSERKIHLGNLRLLSEQVAKAGELSVSIRNQIDDEKKELRKVEAKIRELEAAYKADLEHSPDLPKPLKPSLFGREDPDESDEPGSRSGDIILRPRRSRLSSPILFISIAAIIILVSVFFGGVWSFRKAQEQSTSAILTGVAGEIMIHPGYYHLGDTLIEQFHAPYPQPNPFVANFEITQPGKHVQLALTASHVDPNIEQSPVDIYINDAHITDLNQYFTEENFVPVDVMIPFSSDLIKKGLNQITIEIGATTTEYGQINLDDFEFWDLKLIAEE